MYARCLQISSQIARRARARDIFVSVALLLCVGCRDKATVQCQSEVASAQAVVSKVEATSAASVQAALDSVERALTACRAASRSSEVDELSGARNELRTQLVALEARANRKKRAKPTTAEVEEAIKKGDATCPRGMAYKVEGSDRQIKCTGPQPVRMTLSVAREYYKGLGYRVTVTDSPSVLKAEYGAELLVFSYGGPTDGQGPLCLTLYPPPQMPWQEAVARATGAQLQKIKPGAPVSLPDGDVPVRVEEGTDKLIVRLGKCPP
jgi:hypothetical protein